MGTLATVTLGDSDSDRLGPITLHVQGLFARLEQEMSTYRPDSAISLLAVRAGVAPMAVPEDTYRVLQLAQHYGNLTDGAFDVTVAPVVRLWGFGNAAAPARTPSEEMVRERLRLVGYQRLALHDGTAFLPGKGMAVDLGGIAKGYAVDRAFELCRKEGVEDFLLDLGGNVRASGRPQWGESWQIGVRDPFDRSRIVGKVALPSGMALATSGSYERFVEVLGRRYSHIIDPRTGYPVEGMAGVTILALDATTADALSTAFFVVGLRGEAKLRKQAPTVEVLLVPDKFPTQIWVTPGFAKAFTPHPEFAPAVRILPLLPEAAAGGGGDS
jgi:thiamine biosynthesis lipoprotein